MSALSVFKPSIRRNFMKKNEAINENIKFKNGIEMYDIYKNNNFKCLCKLIIFE